MELHSRSSVRDRYAAIIIGDPRDVALHAVSTVSIQAPEATTCMSLLSPMALNCSMQLTTVCSPQHLFLPH